MRRRLLYVGGSLAILALMTLLGLAFITVKGRSATPTPLVCAAPEQWISYHDPVVGMTVLYPPEAMFQPRQVYTMSHYIKGETPSFTAEFEIRPACNGYNSDCYDSRKISIVVIENIDDLSLEQFVIQTHDGGEVVTEHELSQYTEAVTINRHKAIRFSLPHQSPEWVRRITGHPDQATTPVTFIQHGPFITRIDMRPVYMGIAYTQPHQLPCKQAIQSYDEVLKHIQFD